MGPRKKPTLRKTDLELEEWFISLWERTASILAETVSALNHLKLARASRGDPKSSEPPSEPIKFYRAMSGAKKENNSRERRRKKRAEAAAARSAGGVDAEMRGPEPTEICGDQIIESRNVPAENVKKSDKGAKGALKKCIPNKSRAAANGQKRIAICSGDDHSSDWETDDGSVTEEIICDQNPNVKNGRKSAESLPKFNYPDPIEKIRFVKGSNFSFADALIGIGKKS